MLVYVQSTFQFRVMRGLELTPAVTETDTPMTHLELPFNLKHACLWMSGDTRSTQSHREHRNSARKSQSLVDSNPGTCSVRHQCQPPATSHLSWAAMSVSFILKFGEVVSQTLIDSMYPVWEYPVFLHDWLYPWSSLFWEETWRSQPTSSLWCRFLRSDSGAL